MSRPPVFVTLGSYGADLARRRGQAAFLPIIVASGANSLPPTTGEDAVAVAKCHASLLSGA